MSGHLEEKKDGGMCDSRLTYVVSVIHSYNHGDDAFLYLRSVPAWHRESPVP